jgi:hypothetical protein
VGTLFRNVIIGLVLITLAVALVNSGNIDGLMTTLVSATNRLVGSLRTLLVALALPALLVGGIVMISPKHRQVGAELAVGGLICLAVASLGPAFLRWLDGAFNTYSSTLFTGPPSP